MLPYTPLHTLLLQAFAETCKPGRPAVLVMTSGNLSDKPIAYRDDDAQQRLSSITDGMLSHNREIHMRCDDSVMRIVANGEQFFRRSRGYARSHFHLHSIFLCRLLACGGTSRTRFAWARGNVLL